MAEERKSGAGNEVPAQHCLQAPAGPLIERDSRVEHTGSTEVGE